MQVKPDDLTARDRPASPATSAADRIEQHADTTTSGAATYRGGRCTGSAAADLPIPGGLREDAARAVVLQFGEGRERVGSAGALYAWVADPGRGGAAAGSDIFRLLVLRPFLRNSRRRAGLGATATARRLPVPRRLLGERDGKLAATCTIGFDRRGTAAVSGPAWSRLCSTPQEAPGAARPNGSCLVATPAAPAPVDPARHATTRLRPAARDQPGRERRLDPLSRRRTVSAVPLRAVAPAIRRGRCRYADRR